MNNYEELMFPLIKKIFYKCPTIISKQEIYLLYGIEGSVRYLNEISLIKFYLFNWENFEWEWTGEFIEKYIKHFVYCLEVRNIGKRYLIFKEDEGE